MPRVLDAVYGLSASEKGLVFLPLSVAVVIGSYVGGRLLGHWRPRPMLLVTALLNALSLLLFVAVAPLSLVALVVAVTAFGLFLGLSLPVQTSLLMDLYQHNRATAVGSYNFFRFMAWPPGRCWAPGCFRMATSGCSTASPQRPSCWRSAMRSCAFDGDSAGRRRRR